MGIGWLWIYTHSDNPEPLTRENERRAYIFYSSWRSTLLWVRNIFSGIRAAYHRRVDRRILLALPDHLLRDIGMFRSGSDVQFEKTRRVHEWKNAATTADNSINKSSNHHHPEGAVIMNIDCIRVKAVEEAHKPERRAKG